MRFLADMGISPVTVDFLCNLGHDAVHLHEQRLDRLSDVMILEKARLENRIVLTNDLDFGELVAASGINLPSVIIFRLRSMHPAHVNIYVNRVILQYTKALEDGAIVSVTEGLTRVRNLPIRAQNQVNLNQ